MMGKTGLGAQRRSLVRAAREAAQFAAHIARLDSLIAAARAMDGAVILMYHSVPAGEAAYIDPSIRMPPATFERQVALLARHRRVISLEELVETLRDARTPPRGTVVLSFDDGYLDTLGVAAPVLASYELPAVVFLPTAYIESSEPQWLDAMWNALRFARRHELALEGDRFDLRTSRGSAAAVKVLRSRLLTAPPAQRGELIARVKSDLDSDQPIPRLTMNWEDVRTLRSRYPRITIGGHTRGHMDLTALSGQQCAEEVTRCRDDIRAATGETPTYFSFPYNRTSPAAREAVAAAGFRAGLASGDEFLIRAGHDLMALPRLDAALPPARLGYLTSGAARTLSWRRRP